MTFSTLTTPASADKQGGTLVLHRDSPPSMSIHADLHKELEPHYSH